MVYKEFKAFYSKTRLPRPQSTSSERRLSVARFFPFNLPNPHAREKYTTLVKSFRASY